MQPGMPCSIEEFSETVEAIYDTVVEPERWRIAVKMIAQLCESSLSSVSVLDLKTFDNKCLYDYGYAADFWEKYAPYAGQHPIMPEVNLMPVGGVTTVALSCGDAAYFGSRMYREVFQPRGYRDFIGLLALRTGSRIGYLHCCRTDQEPRYSAAQVNIFNLLSKHVCRAMSISDLFDLQTLKGDMLSATLNGLAAGVFLVARDGRVVHMNVAAERQLKTGNVLRLVNNRLSPSNSAAESALLDALSGAINDEAQMPRGGHSLALPDCDGAGLVATILPLERGERQRVTAPFAAAAAVFVQDPAVVPPMPGEAFAKLYGLTGGELRVAMAMATNLTPQEVADMLGIGLQTVKTHLQRIFQKTCTSRQADLIGLMTRLSTPTKRQ
jgi:DNA-binding CsgD family transcriptional regulator